MKRGILVIIVIILGLIVLIDALYIVSETEQVIITQFGDPVGGAIKKAGLHIKAPFIHKVHYFDKRILEWDGNPNQIPTADKRYIWIDTFARWKIEDPLKFYQSVHNEMNAHSRLDDVVDGATRDNISSNTLIELVRNSNREMKSTEERETEIDTTYLIPIEKGRSAITDAIFNQAAKIVPQYGIKLIDVRIKRINYVKEVRQKVYDRMISERNRIAAKYRAEGEGEKAKILGEMQKELYRIQSEAYEKAQKIKGNADAKATKIYAKAYNKDPEFYSLIQSLEAYKTTVSKNNTLILSTDSEFYKYLQSAK